MVFAQWMSYSMLKTQNTLKGIPSHVWSRRNMSTKKWSSKAVRATFIDYFKDQNHSFIRSSPVVPWNDPTLAFVNAGMNQFKPVFLGQAQPPAPCAVNSQKCIRVGGKHNDLLDVGRDTYHHTFFEMLGNWSFGHYFKREACEMAWELLTQVYKLPSEFLYVTYFGGSEALGLQADLETREIWMDIGVPAARILPFDVADNFWEMGMVGPCGPCTEIHYDRLQRPDASHRVNAGVEDLIELWNLVFIQYERLSDGSLLKLGSCHVDTGMGLERLTAVLNKKTSNYDTDLFIPLFDTIQKISGCAAYSGTFSTDGSCHDTSYRVLADHSRMLTVALADGMFPEESHKLRRIIRRALTIARDHFRLDNEQQCLQELANVVASTLRDAHPQVHDRLDRVNIIIEHEGELLRELHGKMSSEWSSLVKVHPELRVLSDCQSAGLIEGIKETLPQIDTWMKNDRILPGSEAFKLYDTYGLNLELIEELSDIYQLHLDIDGYHSALNQTRKNTKKITQQMLQNNNDIYSKEDILAQFLNDNIKLTNDEFKYDYSSNNGQYIFSELSTKVLAILKDGKLCKNVDNVDNGNQVGVVTEATNLYHEAGGQEGDLGWIRSPQVHLNITDVENVGGYIIHWCDLEMGQVRVGDVVSCRIDADHRIGCMMHHTATHLLNAAVKHVTGLACQVSSHVAYDHFRLDVRTYKPVDVPTLHKIQDIVKGWCSSGSQIDRSTVALQEVLQNPHSSLLPGEVYPDTVHLLTTEYTEADGSVIHSSEPCCGTHIHDTSHLINFVITNMKSAGVGIRSLRGICGTAAIHAEFAGATAYKDLQVLEQEVQMALKKTLQDRISALESIILSWHSDNNAAQLPYVIRFDINSRTDEMLRLLRNARRGNANKQMVSEVYKLVDKNPGVPLICVLETDFGTSKAVLSKAAKVVKAQPSLILARAEGTIVGRATIPKELSSSKLSATAWLTSVLSVVGGQCSTPRGQDPHLVCNFKGPKLDPSVIEKKLEAALTAAKDIYNQ